MRKNEIECFVQDLATTQKTQNIRCQSQLDS